ncbi:MAG TPA: VOC family protein [Nocardioidaceae bacterium]|nr:VOC family protein [Nocardioidaceae bacterium]
MDTTGGEELGRFWAVVAGLSFEPDGAAGDLVGPTEGHGIAMCTVPEPRTVKHRVHLDVYATTTDALTARGATVVLPAAESGFRWTVMADPEGGEFCAFIREPAELPDYTVHGLVVDCADPESVARWWGGVFGVEVDDNDGRGFWTLEGIPGMPVTTMDFVPVPEPKTVKNRIHWDVHGTVEALHERGATLLRARDDDASTGSGQAISWHVMADPEGNEFCVFER